MSSPKRALVLGCGAVAGAAWSIPVLQQLEQELNWDVRDADLLIGTSVGAVLAALIGAGVSTERMMAAQRGEATDCEWNHETDSGGAFPPLPSLSFPGLKLLKLGMRGQVSTLTALTGLLPTGRTDMSGFRRLINNVVPNGDWVPHQATWLMAVDAQSGKRFALGRDDAPKVSLEDAVCASYAVPGCCPPVEIGNHTFVDGGVASPTSADFAQDADIEEAIVLAPFASSHPDKPRSPLTRLERHVRKTMTRIVDSECAKLRTAGIRVIRLEPGREDLQAIGYNMLDPGRRKQVFETSLRTSPNAVRAAIGFAN